ncbi:hypothetical protein SAMN05216276_1010140 [Streptosporangium subroseum]|uniref:Uncharacterized protein n=1 Tax=Streptosporangium subroseum TaxID=106412 RepID=A0A239EYQ5_9ACTN|nr:hypothetical protein SAMN05216276_1010140 [Streptosporangium subroseum]
MLITAFGLAVAGCGSAGRQPSAERRTENVATTAAAQPEMTPPPSPPEDEKDVTGAFDFIYPDHAASAKDPVNIPLTGDPWKLVHLADYGVFDSLTHVVAPAEDDAWAFGRAGGSNASLLALRWDGWQWVESALPGGVKGSVVDAGSSAPDDVWLHVNTERASSALHWDGVRWTVSKEFPFTVGQIEVLDGTHVWALPSRDAAVAWFFDGTGWREVPLPDGVLGLAIGATSPGTLWTVGTSGEGARRATGLFRSDGTGWTRVSFGEIFPADDEEGYLQLENLVTGGEDDVWVFGSRTERQEESGEGERPRSLPVAAHWDGRSWRAVTVPPTWRLREAVPDGRGGAHVIVWPADDDSGADIHTTSVLSLAADGSSSVSLPEVSGGRVSLNDLAATPEKIWGVGAAYPSDVTLTASTSAVYARTIAP